MMNKKHRIVDLFAGGGGLSLGFINAGFNIVAAFDSWEPAVEIYRNNFTDHPILSWDLTDPISIEMIRSFNPTIIIGGPPCQDFSSAGKRDETLGRADLTITFAEIVKEIRPKWFVMENVERAKYSKAIAKLKKIKLSQEYGLTEIVLDACYYGVPQRRKRLFIIGELNGPHDGLLTILMGNQTKKPMTVRDYFGDKLGINNYYRHPRSYQRRAIFSINEPSPTIRGVNRPIPKNYSQHPGDSASVSSNVRPLTTKERSLIQTFPESFKLSGTKSQIEQIIGNAVPVKLAEHVARCLKRHIEITEKICIPELDSNY